MSGELLRRAGVEPGVSVDARGGSSVTRLGGIVLGRGSFAVTNQIAVIVALGAAWFPRRIEYVAAARETFELDPVTLRGGLVAQRIQGRGQ